MGTIVTVVVSFYFLLIIAMLVVSQFYTPGSPQAHELDEEDRVS